MGIIIFFTWAIEANQKQKGYSLDYTPFYLVEFL